MATKQILVVVDSAAGEEQPVSERAAWFAERMGAALQLFTCAYDANIDAGRVATVSIPDADAREQLLRRHRRKLAELAAPMRERGLHVAVDVVSADPLADVLVKRAAAERPWLVAKGAQHHTLLQRTLFTNTDWQLARECPSGRPSPRARRARGVGRCDLQICCGAV
jgi:universal stress protein E